MERRLSHVSCFTTVARSVPFVPPDRQAPAIRSSHRRKTMADTGGDILIETIMDWGVEVIFGIPGDGINGIMEALRKRQDRIRFVQVRHEESAAFMACAY